MAWKECTLSWTVSTHDAMHVLCEVVLRTVQACVAVVGCVPLSLVVPPLFTTCYVYGLFTAVLLLYHNIAGSSHISHTLEVHDTTTCYVEAPRESILTETRK